MEEEEETDDESEDNEESGSGGDHNGDDGEEESSHSEGEVEVYDDEGGVLSRIREDVEVGMSGARGARQDAALRGD